MASAHARTNQMAGFSLYDGRHRGRQVKDAQKHEERSRSSSTTPKRTISMKAVPARARQPSLTDTLSRQPSLTDAFSQSEPNLSFNPDDLDDDNTFAHNSLSDWSSAITSGHSPAPRTRTPVRKAAALRAASFGSKGPNANALAAPSLNGSKKTKVKASELGLRIGKDTTPEEVGEAVKRWRTEQQKSSKDGKATNSDPPAHSAPQNNSTTPGTKNGQDKMAKNNNKPVVTERQLNTAVESPNFGREKGGVGSKEPQDTGPKATKKIVIRRRRSLTGVESSITPPKQRPRDKEPPGETMSNNNNNNSISKLDPSGKKHNPKRTKQDTKIAGPSENMNPARPGTTAGASNPDASASKLTVAKIKADTERVMRRTSKSPSGRKAERQRSRSTSTETRRRGRAKRRSKSPAIGLTTSSDRSSVSSLSRKEKDTTKGRKLSKSPNRGADYRPVSWRLEDSSMHAAEVDGGGSSKSLQNSRRGPRPPASLDENDEVQKRLREAGISMDQYRAMLAVGLTVGIA